MEQRVAALEKGVAEMKADLTEARKDQHTAALALEGLRGDTKAGFAKIDGTLEAIKASLEAKATKADLTPIETKLGTLDGRVSNIPTFWQNIGVIAALLIGLVGVSFTISKLNAPAQPPASSPPPAASGAAPGKAP